jgi:acyl carrier protein
MGLFDKKSAPATGERPTKEAIELWLKRRIAELTELPVDEIDGAQDFSSFGLQSIHGMELSGDLEKMLGRRLSATLVWDYPTISSLARYLAEEE